MLRYHEILNVTQIQIPVTTSVYHMFANSAQICESKRHSNLPKDETWHCIKNMLPNQIVWSCNLSFSRCTCAQCICPWRFGRWASSRFLYLIHRFIQYFFPGTFYYLWGLTSWRLHRWGLTFALLVSTLRCAFSSLCHIALATVCRMFC